MHTEALFRLARIHVGASIPDEWRQSLPVPRRGAKGLQVAFLFCPAVARPGQGVEIAPPDHVASLDASTGALEQLEAVSPAFFHRDDMPRKSLGTFALPKGWTFDTYATKQARLLELYDIVLPAFDSKATVHSPTMRGHVDEFAGLFVELREPQLAPYYEKLGAEFFSWVSRMQGR